jgi:hypothetical protein
MLFWEIDGMKKLLGRGLAVVGILYLVWLGWIVLSFRSYGPPPGQDPAADDGLFELRGVYHIHTTFSDGRGTPRTAARAAARRGLDFIILTDHGNPNFASLDQKGRIEDVLVLAGSELNVNRGHLVALGFDRPNQDFPRLAENAAYDVAAAGGFTIIAHPYSKTRWSWGGFAPYGGLEILNTDAMVRAHWPRIAPRLPALLLRPETVLLRMLDRPEADFRKWDELTASRPMFGYYSSDTHLLYRASFSLLHLHVLLDSPPAEPFEDAEIQILDALRFGRFFNAVGAAAQAAGFRFHAETSELRRPMGSQIASSGPVRFTVRAPFAFRHRIRLLRGGIPVAEGAGRLVHETSDPGVYRVEVHLLEKTPLDPGVPWIASNPIFFRKDAP